MDRGPSIKIWQVNLDRARHATDELRQAACEAKVDLLLIQEPYTIGGRVAGFGAAAVVIAEEDADERPWAAIVVLNRSFSILRVGQLSTPYTACAEITCDQGRMVVASCYMRHSMPKHIFIAQLEVIVNRYPEHHVIIGTDANSKSTLWGSPRADRNGRLMEEFIAAQRLTVLNDGEQGPTFQTANGSSYIDVTLVTERTSGKINSWRLIRDLVTTSHALLETLVGRGSAEEQPVRRWSQRGYDIRRADWEGYQNALQQRVAT